MPRRVQLRQGLEASLYSNNGMKMICNINSIYLICTFVAGLSFSTYAQSQDSIPEFCPDGAVWYYDAGIVFFGVDTLEDKAPYVKIEYVRDTIIDNFNAKILVETSHDPYNMYLDNKFYRNIILRQDGWKIYQYVDSSFHVLYDYTLEVGEMYSLYVDQWLFVTDPMVVFDVQVDSVSEVLVEGENMRAYHAIGNEGSWQMYGWNYFKTGNINYLMPYDDAACEGVNCAWGLRCYQDKDFFWKRTDLPCDALTTTPTHDIDVSSFVQVYPNPTSEVLQLESSTDLKKLEVYDHMGRQILSISNPANEINVQYFSPGRYFLRAWDRDGVSSIQSFMKI